MSPGSTPDVGKRVDLAFGDDATIDASLSARVRGLKGSEILKIAAEIRALAATGRAICNLTVGDFNPKYFPIPAALMEQIKRAYAAGETNYPPSDGVLPLRQSVVDYVDREWGVRYPIDSVLIASGSRPILYAAYRVVLDPGEKVVYPVPSWNNNHYTWISGATGVEVPTRAEDGFQPTLATFAPHLSDASMFCINTPLNPAGTLIDPAELAKISQAIVEENERRKRAGRRGLFMLYDMVYGALVFGNTPHVHPAALVPAVAPWVISLDGISKSYAATGLRVGWVLAAPAVVARMRDLLGHIGAWAPRPEQAAVAAFLADAAAVRAFRDEMDGRVRERLDALHDGFAKMKADGYPVDCVQPQGAIYLSLRLDLIGRTLGGQKIETNDAIRHVLLEQAGLAVVPFQAFGLADETGWFRLSVGAVSLEEIRDAFPRLRTLLETVRQR